MIWKTWTNLEKVWYLFSQKLMYYKILFSQNIQSYMSIVSEVWWTTFEFSEKNLGKLFVWSLSCDSND